MERTVIRVREPREILAAIPYQLGFVPQESLVAVSIRRHRRSVGLMVRIDLADLADRDTGPALARSVAQHLEADGAGSVVLAGYTQRAAELRCGRGEVGRALRTMQAALPPTVVADGWWVGPNGYGGIGCPDESCCPAAGRALAELESTQVGASMVFAGAGVLPSRRSLGVSGPAPEEARRAATAAALRERRRITRPGSDGAVRAARAHELWARLCHEAATGIAFDPPALGEASVALEHPALRDAVIARHGIGPALARQGLDGTSGAAALFAQEGPPPDREALAPLRTVLEAIVRHVPVRRRGPALAVLALLAWWEGDGARAAVVLEQCRRADPRSNLAALVADALTRGVPPGWVRLDRAADVADADRPGT